MKIRNLFLVLFFIGNITIYGMDNADNNSYNCNPVKHDIRIWCSDALPLTISNCLGESLADALTGSRSDMYSTGMIGIGYRYNLGRFKAGTDLGFLRINSKHTPYGGSLPTLKEKTNHFLIIPTGEFAYYKRGIIRLYGSAGAGVMLYRSEYSPLGSKKQINDVPSRSGLSCNFAFQTNPIAIEISNQRIGGYLEAGIGYKGFCTAGLIIKL